MKKRLLLGLFIILTANLVALTGVAYNRSAKPSAQLMLTERELSLPNNNYAFNKENSAISLRLRWRMASTKNKHGFYLDRHKFILTEPQLLALGFSTASKTRNYWHEHRALYWALEYDGTLYQAELTKATHNYQKAVADFNQLANEHNRARKDRAEQRLKQEKVSKSRLFLLDISADYQQLADKYQKQSNIVIVKGLARPDYNKQTDKYNLSMRHLLIRDIMLPSPFADKLKDLLPTKRLDSEDKPRYRVTVNWGQRLEPWITDIQRVTDK